MTTNTSTRLPLSVSPFSPSSADESDGGVNSMQLWDCLHCYGGGIVVGGAEGHYYILYYFCMHRAPQWQVKCDMIITHTHRCSTLGGGGRGVSSTVTFTPSSLTYAGIHMWLCCHLLTRPSSLCLQIKVQPSPPWITERHEVNI